MSTLFPWQVQQWQQIQNSRKANRLPHALLLSGHTGLGKYGFANHLAAALLCERPDEQGHACGQCKSCLLLQAGSHPDIHSVLPEEQGKAIKVDQIRALSDVMSRKSQLSGYRVCIVSPAEAMNVNASNALLKTLEEPGENAMIMLVSSEPGRLSATIRSRCQLISFMTPEPDISEKWLKEQGVTDQIPLLLGLTNAAPLQAMSYVEDNRLQTRGEFMQEFMGLKTGVQNPVQMAAKWVKNHPQHCVQWMMFWVMDLIRLKSAQSAAPVMNVDVQEHLQQMAKQLDLKNLFNYLDKLQISLKQLTTQVNAQMMLEDLFITWIKTR